jgi:GLPGLI family protein
MNKFFLLINLIACSMMLGQAVSFGGNFTMPNTQLKVNNLDYSKLNVFYEYQVTEDYNGDKRKNGSNCVLQIGERVSAYMDIKQLIMDSLMVVNVGKKTLDNKEMNEMTKNIPRYKKAIIREKDKTIVQSNLSPSYQYEEVKPVFNWKLEQGEKRILGYVCNKATTKFKGREYTAWYAKDLNVNAGPYKFEGLPGLIMEVEDSENIFHFTAVAINKIPKPIYLISNPNTIVTTEKKYKEFERNYFANPAAYITAKAYDQDGNLIVPKSKPIPYNPIELE